MKKTYIKPSLLITNFNNCDIVSISNVKFQTGKFIEGTGINIIEF